MAKNTLMYMISLMILIIMGIMVWQRHNVRDWYIEATKEPVPIEKTVDDFVNVPVENDGKNDNININNNVNVAPETITIPDTINLAIPFTSQAPLANWDALHEESCEEASMLMSARFLQNRSITDATDAETAIQELVAYNANTLQYPVDTTAAETAKAIEQFYHLNTELVYNFSWEDVKRALAQGYPVILPAAGRQLGNPYYTAPGPLYHMLVIKGYTANKIITNDPGTKRGANYQYSYDTLYNAAHDWNDGNVTTGKKVIIIVKPQ